MTRDVARLFLLILVPLASGIRNLQPGPEVAAVEKWKAFQNYKVVLAKNQSQFVKNCHEANPSLSSRVSCGNTAMCFEKLWSNDSTILRNLRMPKSSLERALGKTEGCSRKGKKFISSFIAEGVIADMPMRFMDPNHVQILLDSANCMRSFLSQSALYSVYALFDELSKDDDPKDLPRVFFPYFSWMEVNKQGKTQWHWQNHIFALIKSSNEEFHLLQGYIAGSQEPGYDLSDWICSRNAFANVHGFGRFSLLTWDGENHAAAFLVKEVTFEGKEYVPAFAWMELDTARAEGPMIKQMVMGEREKKIDDVKLEELCKDQSKIHEGKLLPGENLKARPGKKLALSSDDEEAWSIPVPNAAAWYAVDQRTA